MIIIGVDFHPAHEEIASVDTDTGEYQEKRLAHPQEAEEFYRSLASLGKAVRVGIDDLPLDWSRDGHNLLYLEPPDLWVYSFVESKSHSLLKATASLNYAQFSPDSKWVAYSSNESGRWEVYVTSFPDARGKWQTQTSALSAALDQLKTAAQDLAASPGGSTVSAVAAALGQVKRAAQDLLAAAGTECPSASASASA